MSIMGIAIIVIVTALWIWGVIDVWKGKLRGPARTRWIFIILVMPLVGFFLYFCVGKKKYEATSE